MKTRKIALLFMVIVLLMSCGCEPVFIKKDKLTMVDGDELKTDVQILEYQTLFNGKIESYDIDNSTAVYTSKSSTSDSFEEYSLNYYNDLETKTILTSIDEISRVEILKESEKLAFETINSSDGKVMLYLTGVEGEKKELIYENVVEKFIPWSVSDSGNVVFLDEKNDIYLYSTASENANVKIKLYTVPMEYSVKEIRYISKYNILYLLASNNLSDNVLYRLDISKDSAVLDPIELNVSSFEVANKYNYLIYNKTNTALKEELYIYKQNGEKLLITEGSVEMISISNDDRSIAFSTKPSQNISTQSIWVMRYGEFDAVQLTASTQLISDIYWGSSPNELIYSIEVKGDSLNQKTEKIEFMYINQRK